MRRRFLIFISYRIGVLFYLQYRIGTLKNVKNIILPIFVKAVFLFGVLMLNHLLITCNVIHLQVELDNYIGAIKQQIQNLKPRLISMKTSLEQDEKHLNASWNSADMRIRKHQMESLMKKLSDLIEQFTAAQTDYRQRVASKFVFNIWPERF